MLSIRFIALVVASIATLAVPTPAIVAPQSDIPGDVIRGCQTSNFRDACDTIGFVENVCTHLPSRQVNNMDSVEVPVGWACVFYDARSDTPCTETDPNTTLVAPGSDDLNHQRFGDSLDAFKCHQV